MFKYIRRKLKLNDVPLAIHHSNLGISNIALTMAKDSTIVELKKDIQILIQQNIQEISAPEIEIPSGFILDRQIQAIPDGFLLSRAFSRNFKS